MTNWTSGGAFDEFQTRYENTIPAADVDRVTAFLVDAYALVEDVTGADYIASVTGDMPTGIVAVICAAARRAYDNPSNLQSETIGDYTWRGSGNPSGVCFTPAEIRTVRRAAGQLSVGTLELTTYLPLPPIDPTYAYMNEDGVVIVNAAEPDDLP